LKKLLKISAISTVKKEGSCCRVGALKRQACQF
jgi:hypothetical protein